MKHIIILFTAIALISCNAPLESPSEQRNFESPASAAEVIAFAKRAAKESPNITYYAMGQSDGGTELASVRIHSPQTAKNQPLKILIFAQQHGNEQSGKEASLLLIRDMALGMHSQWLLNLDIWIVPQLNPDGADQNQRRNAGGIDLNRDHLVQLASETRALHALFRQFMPHVTLDMHEYFPFGESWQEFGAFKNFDVQAGVLTNINIAQELRDFGLNQTLPYLEQHLKEKGFSFHNYIVGPAPHLGRTRHSTVDFDDGRHSFGILNTLSFIYEGINGHDRFIANLERRTYGQYEALWGLLDFLNGQAQPTLNMVEHARAQLSNAAAGDSVAIRMEHFSDGSSLILPLISSHTGLDTIVLIENYHPSVEATLKVIRPTAYLVPLNDTILMNFLNLHQIQFTENFSIADHEVFQYNIEQIFMHADEELSNRFPQISNTKITQLETPYVWVSTAQLHSNFLVSVFEPQSMLGLAQRPGYEYLMKEGSAFPVLRVDPNKHL